MLSCVWLFMTPWTVAHQALLSIGFSRQEYWSGLPFPTPGDLSNPGIESSSSAMSGIVSNLIASRNKPTVYLGCPKEWKWSPWGPKARRKLLNTNSFWGWKPCSPSPLSSAGTTKAIVYKKVAFCAQGHQVSQLSQHCPIWTYCPSVIINIRPCHS